MQKGISNVTFYHLSNKCVPNIRKINVKINTMQNINILLFVHLTVLNKLKALQLSTVGQLTIKHQHSKKLT